MAAPTNPNFIHGNWNPARSSTNNIFLKNSKRVIGNAAARLQSHEYPITPANNNHINSSNHCGALQRGTRLASSIHNYFSSNNSKEYDHYRHPLYVNNFPHGHHLHPRNHLDGYALASYSNNGYSESPESVSIFTLTKHGFQYRSNPQISFASSSLDNITGTASASVSTSTDDFDTLSTTYDKSSCNPVRLAVTRNSNRNKNSNYKNESSHHQQIQKWKNELTAAASNIPRKWCDFVFRRNEDNKVYRSESFRFIQKTNSLALLTPSSGSSSSSNGNQMPTRHGRNKRIPHHGVN